VNAIEIYFTGMIRTMVLCVLPVFCLNAVDLLPIPDSVPGLDRNAKTGCVNGTVSFAADLYKAIDGGAEVYIDNGFCAGAFGGYLLNGQETCIEIYDQGSAKNARIVYDSTTTGEYRFLKVPLICSRIDTSSPFATIFEGVHDRFFIRLSRNARDTVSENMLVRIAREISKKK